MHIKILTPIFTYDDPFILQDRFISAHTHPHIEALLELCIMHYMHIYDQ